MVVLPRGTIVPIGVVTGQREVPIQVSPARLNDMTLGCAWKNWISLPPPAPSPPSRHDNWGGRGCEANKAPPRREGGGLVDLNQPNRLTPHCALIPTQRTFVERFFRELANARVDSPIHRNGELLTAYQLFIFYLISLCPPPFTGRKGVELNVAAHLEIRNP